MFAGPAGVRHVAAVAVVGPVAAAAVKATTHAIQVVVASEVRAPTYLARRRCGSNLRPPPIVLPTLPVCARIVITVVCAESVAAGAVHEQKT